MVVVFGSENNVCNIYNLLIMIIFKFLKLVIFVYFIKSIVIINNLVFVYMLGVNIVLKYFNVVWI